MGIEISTKIILLGGLLALVLGAVVNKTNFCTMGAVSDWVNMGDTTRLRAWIFAMVIAILGVALLEAAAVMDTGTSRVPYRGSLFLWPRYIIGGVMFGIGMTLASGCGNKNLVRLGGGNLKSLLVVLVAGGMAYLMTRTDFYGVFFHSWMEPLSPDLGGLGVDDQSLGVIIGSLLGMERPASMNLYIALLLSGSSVWLLFRSSDFRSNRDQLLGGVIVGLVVVGGWYITAGPMGQMWLEAVEFMDDPPPGTGSQSYTFINPMADALVLLSSGARTKLITFGVAALLGVILGSLLFALLARRFRIEWFVDLRDFLFHLIGAVLMGVGGVLALGCTIGQGVTGVSTLALGSFFATASIILGSALTLKIQYYKLVYESEASFGKALVSGLVDLRLLPKRLRKLDAL